MEHRQLLRIPGWLAAILMPHGIDWSIPGGYEDMGGGR
jgi:hypothetical protein